MASIFSQVYTDSAADFNLFYTMEKDNDMIDRDLGCASYRLDAPCNTPQEIVTSMEIFSRLNVTPLFVNTEALSSLNTVDFTSPRAPPLHPMLALPLLFSISIIIITLTLRKLIRHYRRPNIFPASTRLPPCGVKPHPIFGHMPHVFSSPDSAEFKSVFVDHANSSGISTFWFLNVPCVSVLKAEHARIVFRNSIERTGSKVINRHFKRCLGQGESYCLDYMM